MSAGTKGKASIGLLLWLLLMAIPASADQLTVGAEFPALALKDQHDQLVSIPADTRLVLFAVGKTAADLVSGFLKGAADDFLEQNSAVYLADISGMPALITRMFALPKMRDLPYRILLAEDAETLAFLPRQSNQVTVVRLEKGLVQRVDFVDDASALSAVF